MNLFLELINYLLLFANFNSSISIWFGIAPFTIRSITCS
jgi:hypothetical protein